MMAICLCLGFINVGNMQSVCNGYKIEIQAILEYFQLLENNSLSVFSASIGNLAPLLILQNVTSCRLQK